MNNLIVRRGLSLHQRQYLHLLRFSALCGKDGRWPECSLEEFNNIQRIITSGNWIASMVCRRSSSEEYSQDSRRWTSSKRFKILWKIYSVNLSNSTTGSSSCQCTTTLYGEKKETQKSMFIILLQLRSTHADYLVVVGLSWDLDQKRNGTEITVINQTETGTKLLNEWCSTLRKQSSDTSCHQRTGKRRIKKQREKKELQSLQR